MVSVIIPTYNAGKYLPALLKKIREQSIRDLELIVVDSSSKDNTLEIARSFDAKTILVAKENFDHGGTRTFAGKQSKGEIIVFLTQDALPANQGALSSIIAPIQADPSIGAVYGRQIPYPEASPFAAHSRNFIYPQESFVRTLEDKSRYKIKTAFLSNAFSAYSREALESIGWFKENLISTEDTYAGAKMLMAGYKLAYSAEAAVCHSHNYTVWQEFKRYFDIGSFHKNENWIIEEFGKANDEGVKYLLSELSFILKSKKFWLLGEFFLRNLFKICGYRLGYHFKLLPKWLIKKWSMHRGWWEKME
jgi:rhamnosyltransferase